ncbi:MAG: prepilin-type N-terminal cleavage/methylation domain-containing protein [Verrucomicrobia bacterium]|nr:prepilin-type N-terminal cleavage/methylation domain-containing protein [Verrucomicrobiota bacterium]
MKNRGYSLVETLVASGILLVAIGAAVSLAVTMTAFEEGNAKVSRAFNYQEQAARLYHLGLTPDEISGLLPAESAVESLTFTTDALVIANLGTVETATLQMEYQSGATITSATAGVNQVNTITLVRPSIR